MPDPSTADSNNADSNNKIAIITGAGTGIGKSAALALLGEGYAVVLSGRRREPLEAVAAEATEAAEAAEAAETSAGEASGSAVLVAPADVSDAASVRSLFARTKEAFGRLDLLFNNAGVGAPAVPLEDLTLEQWQTVVEINLTGTFLCTQQAFRMMKAQSPPGGRIINNGSISAQAPRPNSAPYTATKHAITGLTKAASLDGRQYGIACGQIDIGNAATEMTAPMAKGVPQANGSIEAEPTMDVDNVARAIVYMAGLPLDANVQFMTVMATKMPFVGRG